MSAAAPSAPPLSRLIAAFQARNPRCEVRFQEVEAFDGYRALRQGDIDVLCNWLAVDESDLTAARRPRRGRDLRPIPLGLVWSAGRDNARRALEDVARSMSPLPPAA